MKKISKLSLRVRLIAAFVGISILPVMFTIWLGYHRNGEVIRENAEAAARDRVNQIQTSLDVWLESYEDILFQIYTNDEIVELVETINRRDANLTVARGQLRRTLRGLFYTKEHIKSITIITDCGEVVFYDLLTGKTTKTSWMERSKYTQQELYNLLSEDNRTHVLTTQSAGTYTGKDYYLFHLGHRIINYKDVEKRIGTVIVSIDETMLKEICGNEEDSSSYTLLADQDGALLSYPAQELLGTKIIEWSEDESLRQEQYLSFVQEQGIFSGQNLTVNTAFDEKFGCEIVSVSNQNELLGRLASQQSIMISVMIVTALLLIVSIVVLTYGLTASLHKLVGTMKEAEKGELSARVEINERMLPEVETIALQFNHMLGKVEQSVERERLAIEREKNAEIEVLEAQINPHFLYNTLDTINWMAIDHDEFEISNSIMSMAKILRYGIDKSNGIVTVWEECEWLKQYIFLQQTRLRGQFECEIHVAPEIREWKIHKLLLQPFVENSILHGFEGRTGIYRLGVTIVPEGDSLNIEIYDNGKGIPADILERMNRGEFPKTSEKNHIGMENAITRIQMYYGEEAGVYLKSEAGSFTEVHIKIPKRVE